MKYLFVGDIHNHSYIFDDIYKLDNEYNFDRIIFAGDYVDDWLTDGNQSLETLEKVINLKKLDINKYTLLIGNHELSYLGYRCSGHCDELEDEIGNKLKENIDLFDFYTSVQCDDKEFICTHAGISNVYVNSILNGKENWRQKLDDMNKNKLENLVYLSLCSYARGGSSSVSSFVWADAREHLYYNGMTKPIIPYQIVGHSPVKHIINKNDFIFIDTHSTYKDGSPYGDKSYLMWNEKEFKIIKEENINEQI